MTAWKTIGQMLAYHAETSPNHLFVRFLRRGEVIATYTYSQAWDWAARWATLLTEHGLRRGDTAILALPNSEDFLGAYFGTLLAGGIPAPTAPLRRADANDMAVDVLAQRLRFLGSKVLVVPESQASLKGLEPLAALTGLRVVSRLDVPPGPLSNPDLDGGEDAMGLYQFTSGTSGNAKVVQLTQKALLTQTRAISRALKLDRTVDWAVSWLPLFHDMGLIGYLLTPCYAAGHVSFLTVEDFIMRPTLWIKALSDLQATITGGPPSAYALCARRMNDSDVEQYDLRRLRIALVGAEMTSSESLRVFADKFERAGFRSTSLMPTYGMAENGLAITMTPLEQGPEFDTIDLQAMQEQGIAKPVVADMTSGDGSTPGPRSSAKPFACVGVPLIDTEIAIADADADADADGERLGERRIGEVLVKSPSLMSGYYRQPEETEAAMRDGWLWTGDLGYMAGNKLYLTGRRKEVLIVGGRNYYPDDIEECVRSLPGVRLGRVVATGHEEPMRATEVVVVMAETDLTEQSERDDLRHRIRTTLTGVGYPIGKVVLLPPRSIQTTLNGKLKRLQCRERYLAGEFGQ
jgi:fatty-acyl-CoA synthase